MHAGRGEMQKNFDDNAMLIRVKVGHSKLKRKTLTQLISGRVIPIVFMGCWMQSELRSH